MASGPAKCARRLPHSQARESATLDCPSFVLGIKRKKNGSPPSSRSLYSCQTDSAATACRYTATPAFESLDAAGHEVPKISLLRARRAALSIERKAATLRQRTYPAAATPRFAGDVSSSRPRRRRDLPETYTRRGRGGAAIRRRHFQPRRIRDSPETYPAAAAPRYDGDVSARGCDAAAARCDFRPADTLGHEVVEPRVAAVG